jgi:FtsH-binding integral membrane protein
MLPYLTHHLIAGNIGIMVFFTVAVAPTIFAAQPPQWSAAYVHKFFPKYFFFLGCTTAIALALAFAFAFAFVAGNNIADQAALLGCALVFFFNCFWLTLRTNRVRDEKQVSTFKTLR